MTTIDLFDADMSEVANVVCETTAGSQWTFGNPDAHCPEDRCGEPFRIDHLVRDSWGRRAFIFKIECGHFGVYYFVLGDCFQDAWDWLCEDERALVSLRVDPDYASDYAEDERTYNGCGDHIDTDHLFGGEVEVTRIS